MRHRRAAHGLFLELDERRARVVLNTVVEEDIDEWYLDSGATHHMTGRRELFTDLDGDVSGSVRFGDASRVDIQGVGTIAFEGKNGERWLLHGIFYIPVLKNSIMRLGRLDKDGSEVRIRDGVLRVWDQRRRLRTSPDQSPVRSQLPLHPPLHRGQAAPS